MDFASSGWATNTYVPLFEGKTVHVWVLVQIRATTQGFKNFGSLKMLDFVLKYFDSSSFWFLFARLITMPKYIPVEIVTLVKVL